MVQGPDAEGLDELARELRTHLGGEMRADAEEAERMAAQAARRRQAITDLARLHMARGETIAVTVAGRRFTGGVVHAAGDLLSLDTPRGRVDVCTTAPLTLTVPGGASSPGREPPPAAAGTFLARLRQLELEADEVELGIAGADTQPRGVLDVVAADHVVVATADGDMVVSLPAVQWVARRASGGRRRRA